MLSYKNCVLEKEVKEIYSQWVVQVLAKCIKLNELLSKVLTTGDRCPVLWKLFTIASMLLLTTGACEWEFIKMTLIDDKFRTIRTSKTSSDLITKFWLACSTKSQTQQSVITGISVPDLQDVHYHGREHKK
jgi:hypothetical protein